MKELPHQSDAWCGSSLRPLKGEGFLRKTLEHKKDMHLFYEMHVFFNEYNLLFLIFFMQVR